MTLDDLDGVEGLLGEGSREGSRQQLMSPPRMSWKRENKVFEKIIIVPIWTIYICQRPIIATDFP